MISVSSPKTRMVPEDGLVELAGDPPRWIWAFTCPTPGCDCRTATVITTVGDRDALIERCAPVRSAWLRAESHAKAAANATGTTSFALDIDEGAVFAIDSDNRLAPFDFAAHPDARDVVDRINGDVLDAIGRLWYRGKGWPDPEVKSRSAAQIALVDWQPGEAVAWGEALVGVRQDIYRFGDRVFEASDLYCVTPGCDCREVVLDFAPLVPRGAPSPGAIRVARSGAPTFEPEHERHRERLEELWAAFRKRHPRYVERFARRSAVMQEIAPLLVGAPRGGVERRHARVGRNEPCPCGSGKKYKKCCGAT